MPQVSKRGRLFARVYAAYLVMLRARNTWIEIVFFIGLLLSGRVVLLGTLAIYHRFRLRYRKSFPCP
jgi:hypothetical protein